MRKGDCSICSNVADFTMAVIFLLPQREEKLGKMRKGDCYLCSNLADFTMAASFLLPQREEKGEKRTLQIAPIRLILLKLPVSYHLRERKIRKVVKSAKLE